MGYSQTEIAKCIGVHKSMISRELKRNSGQRGCRPKQVHRKAQERCAVNSICIQETAWTNMEEKPRLDWNPERAAGWLKTEKQTGCDLYSHLRCQKKRRK